MPRSGSAFFQSLGFDSGNNLVQRQIAEGFRTLCSVVARSRAKLAQEAKRIHNAQVPGSAIRVGYRFDVRDSLRPFGAFIGCWVGAMNSRW